MKKSFIYIVGLTILCLTSVTQAKEPMQITVGLKVWNATWEHTEPGFPTLKSNAALLAGPTIGLRKGKFFAGVTFMFGDFDFQNIDGCKVETSVPCGLLTLKLEADRKDLDLVFGYHVQPNWGVLVGYKTIDLTLDARIIDNSGTIPNSTFKLDEETSGPVIGVIFNVPLGRYPLIVFGNISYLLLKSETSGEPSEDAPGFSGEIAVAYSLENFPVSLTFGFKAQRFKADTIEDDVKGLIFGANYTFR